MAVSSTRFARILCWIGGAHSNLASYGEYQFTTALEAHIKVPSPHWDSIFIESQQRRLWRIWYWMEFFMLGDICVDAHFVIYPNMLVPKLGIQIFTYAWRIEGQVLSYSRTKGWSNAFWNSGWSDEKRCWYMYNLGVLSGLGSLQQSYRKVEAEKITSNHLVCLILPTPVMQQKRTVDGDLKKRSYDLHRSLFTKKGLPDGAELAYFIKGKSFTRKYLEGYKKGDSIVCRCCERKLSPSQFEAHAGLADRRQPYRHICTSNGMTLHDIALSLANGQRFTTGRSDDICAICGNAGDLLLCHECRLAFHPACLNIEHLPEGDWRCGNCADENGLGRKNISGEAPRIARPIEIRLTRVVEALEFEIGGCAVCRRYDFSPTTFGDRTIILCDQCEKEFHVGCLRDCGQCDLKEIPKGTWFCCDDCKRIHGALQSSVSTGMQIISATISNKIRKKNLGNGLCTDEAKDCLQWQILSGKSHYSKDLPLLSSAAAIFHECFDPIIAKSGHDLIPAMVNGRDISGYDFGGMYCVVLIYRSVVVSVGLLRIFGREVAELPIVATSKKHQGKGYFRALFDCIEEFLTSQNVENLMLPAAEEALPIWKTNFGFEKMNEQQLMNYQKQLQLMIFKETTMMVKKLQIVSSSCSSKADCKISSSSSNVSEPSNYIRAASILLPDGIWKQIPGGVTAAKGFRAAGLYGGLRAKGEKPDLALVTCDVDANVAGAFTKNVVAAAPVVYCKTVLNSMKTGDAGYLDVIECANALATILKIEFEEVLIESTGVIGQRIKKEALLSSLPRLVNSLSPSFQGAESAAVAITTTDLVSKSVAIEYEVGGTSIRIGGMAKGSGMIHHNMETMLGVITTDALVERDVWRKMVQVAVSRSFNQITVDGLTSTNDTVIAFASGLAGSNCITSMNTYDAAFLQAGLDAVMQGLAKSIAWDGEGATCLIEVTVSGAIGEAEAGKIARSVAASSLVKAAVYGRDPNWGCIATAAGCAGISFDLNKLRILLGDIMLADGGEPLEFDRLAASNYLIKAGETHGTVEINIVVGDGDVYSKAWGCVSSYDHVKINAEHTT
ncbi:hypothetical protein V6N13_097077 [Hibiscus sabdariffa]|uniref:Arginine biosynthesis bifunctional protein ArgJ, chloroplastic n=1 Tax=Hibiscus sabdariffa TaxID=183260 RepID=A0ABR2BYU1_9ROSI